ncbi:MAG TPA: hypothetical protein PK771_05860 [Spirochaetota bacterium]|nr:hypothetical protein [Spirochaetota bacterium]
MKKIFIVFVVILTFIGCEKLDVIGKYSVTSFSNLIENKEIKINEEDNYYTIELNDGNSFGMSKFFSKDLPHFNLDLDAADFIQAGLDVNKLDGNYVFDKDSNRIKINFKTDNDSINSNNGIEELFKQIVKYKRGIIGYHEDLDHYGISLGKGNAFEWAKDLKTNDKDVVFVLYPEPFINAGLNPDNLKSWIYAKVKIKDERGNPKEVFRFLKPYNLGE